MYIKKGGGMECELLGSCSFYEKMSGFEGAHKHLRSKYCKRNAEDCARYIVYKALGKEKIPEDLFPVEKERAFAIISRFKGNEFT